MSDSAPKPWSIRGISEDTRKVAIDAAERADLGLGPWISHAIRQTAASDRGGVAGEVVSDRVSNRAPERDSLEVVAMLFAGLGQVAGVKGCGGIAARARAVLDQHLAGLALAPIPPRQARPQISQPPELHAVSSTAA